MSINTFKVRDGRIRVYKKYVYKLCSVLFRPSLLRAVRSCSIFSGLLLVSQSLASILSRSRTVTLSFYPSSLSHTHTHTLPRKSVALLLSFIRRHSYFRLIHSRPILCIYHYIHHATHHRNIIIVII